MAKVSKVKNKGQVAAAKAKGGYVLYEHEHGEEPKELHLPGRAQPVEIRDDEDVVEIDGVAYIKRARRPGRKSRLRRLTANFRPPPRSRTAKPSEANQIINGLLSERQRRTAKRLARQ